MKVFGNYARYYDLIYTDKDYTAESRYIHELLQVHAPHAKTVLDLGCGTGRHDVLLTEQGYHVHGVDMSEQMLTEAERRRSELNPCISELLSFSYGDVRNVRLEQEFDAVVSLFHVMSYQTSNEDLLSAFQTAASHLKSGGVFLFDCWYGPAVLTDRPEVRVKRLEDEVIEVVRIAEPEMHANENIVNVNYQILIRDKASEAVKVLRETHRMRYLFKPEVELLLKNSGFKMEGCCEFLTDREPGFNTWSVCFIGRKL